MFAQYISSATYTFHLKANISRVAIMTAVSSLHLAFLQAEPLQLAARMMPVPFYPVHKPPAPGQWHE